MSREIQKRNRELKNALSLLLKECPKVYKSQKVKKIDYMLWITKNQMIYSFFPTVRVQENNNKPILRVQIEYKPIWVDNLLWDILGMEENKKSPDSLKVIGAFTARCAEYGRYIIELPAEDIESVRGTLYAEVNKFLKITDGLNESMYINELLTSDSVSNIDKALVYIHQGEISKAEAMIISEKERGRFSVGEKTYKELALDYIRTIK